MNKSLSAAITTMLLITSSAWAASPEGQAIRPMGDNQPDPSPTEQADQQMGERQQEERNRNDDMRDQRRDGKGPHGEERWKDKDYDSGNENGKERNRSAD